MVIRHHNATGHDDELEELYLLNIIRFFRDYMRGDAYGIKRKDLSTYLEEMSQDKMVAPFIPPWMDEERSSWSAYEEQEFEEEDEPAMLVVNASFRELEHFGGTKTLSFLRAWLQFYPEANPMLVGDILSSINPTLAAKEVIPLLKHKDPDIVRAATHVLHRLEFGQIGISEEGVRYLEKIYDLGEKNNLDYFAQRLTANGDIGIFDEKKKLINHFKLEGLDSDEARIKARVLDFTYETLFTPQKNETLEERVQREQYINDFQENYFGFYNNAFFEETGVRYNNLSFKEQGQLLLFYKSASDEEKKRVLGFIRQYKEGGFRAFLSLERGREMGEAILAIGETLPHEAAGRVFAKYSEVVFATEDVRQYLCETFGGVGKNSEVMVDGVVENLLCKGKDLLVRFAHEAQETRTKGACIETRDILHQLVHIKTDILLFASAFREAIKSDKLLAFDAIRDTTMESRCSVTLTDEEQGEMRRIFQENRKGVYPAQLLADSLKDIGKALQSKRAQFYLLKHKDELVGFLRFERLPNGHLYLGSLNVRPETRGSSLGTAFVGALLDQYEAGTIEAVVYDRNIASQKLLGKFGFVVTGKIENYHGAGETFFTMERPAKSFAEQQVEEPELAVA